MKKPHGFLYKLQVMLTLLIATKKIYWLQQKQQEKELSTKSVSESEKQVLKVIKAIQEYENNFVFSLKRKSPAITLLLDVTCA